MSGYFDTNRHETDWDQNGSATMPIKPSKIHIPCEADTEKALRGLKRTTPTAAQAKKAAAAEAKAEAERQKYLRDRFASEKKASQQALRDQVAALVAEHGTGEVLEAAWAADRIERDALSKRVRG